MGVVTGEVGFYSPSQTLEVAGGSDGRGGAATLRRACLIESDMQGAERTPGATRVIAVASTTAMLQDVGRKEGGTDIEADVATARHSPGSIKPS